MHLECRSKRVLDFSNKTERIRGRERIYKEFKESEWRAYSETTRLERELGQTL